MTVFVFCMLLFLCQIKIDLEEHIFCFLKFFFAKTQALVSYKLWKLKLGACRKYCSVAIDLFVVLL